METQAQDPRKGGTSASSAPADRACPGRHLAQRGIPEPERSEDSKFGDEIHEALATGDASKLSVEQFDIYEGCQEITNKLLSAVFGADASKAKVFRKQRFWCKVRDVVPNPSADGEKVEVQYLHSGEPDAVYRLGDTLLIPDFKTLPGALPDSPENEQLRDYVVMAARHLVAKRAAVAIVQPLVTYTPQLCLYDEADIARAEKEMFERIKASNSEKSPRIPGELQCKYCRAKNGCQPYQQYAKQHLPAVSLGSVPVEQWSPEQMAVFCEHKAVARKWIDDTEKFIKEAMKKDPELVPGFFLEEGDTREKVNDVNMLHQRFVEAGGTTEAFLSCVGVTKKALKEAAASATKLKGKALDAKIKALLDGITTSSQNEPSIAKKK